VTGGVTRDGASKQAKQAAGSSSPTTRSSSSLPAALLAGSMPHA
jgi:hypothetical protein